MHKLGLFRAATGKYTVHLHLDLHYFDLIIWKPLIIQTEVFLYIYYCVVSLLILKNEH